MNAINHAATALLLKRHWPSLPLAPALIAVQLIEFLWVFLNLAGIEHTTTEPQVRSLADIHLWDMPYSHSLASAALLAGLAWFCLAKLAAKPTWALPIAIGVSPLKAETFYRKRRPMARTYGTDFHHGLLERLKKPARWAGFVRCSQG